MRVELFYVTSNTEIVLAELLKYNQHWSQDTGFLGSRLSGAFCYGLDICILCLERRAFS